MNRFRCVCCDVLKPQDDIEAQWAVLGTSQGYLLFSESTYQNMPDSEMECVQKMCMCLKCHEEIGTNESNSMVLHEFRKRYVNS